MDYERFLLKNFTFWNLYLHENQCYLGRVYILTKRLGLVDILDITERECNELIYIASTVKSIIKKLFSPDLMNYASLGNRYRNLHIHIIPRYEDTRLICGQVFKDKRWGQNFSPYNRDYKTSSECLEHIKKLYQDNLLNRG